MISGADVDRIGRALESVRGWTAEQIVVVNNDVRDGTDKVAEKLGAKVFREPWKEHIAQKNSAATKAGQPWILGLDSDEEVSEGLRKSITRFMMSVQVDAPAAFRMARCSLFLGRWIRHGDWYPDWQTRLWKAGHAKWGGVDPHDRLEVEGRVGTLHGNLLHYSNPSISSYVSKINYFSDLYLESRLKKEPGGLLGRHPSALFGGLSGPTFFGSVFSTDSRAFISRPRLFIPPLSAIPGCLSIS